MWRRLHQKPPKWIIAGAAKFTSENSKFIFSLFSYTYIKTLKLILKILTVRQPSSVTLV